MRRLLLPSLLLLFLITNHAAFHGYFQDDDFDSLSWAPFISLADYGKRLLSPVFARAMFRPVGHLMYYTLGRTVGLNFTWYVACLQAVHLLNIGLVWRLLQRLNFTLGACYLGTLFFAIHPACFDAYFRPLFIFDVTCATFCLLSLLAYSKGRWVLSFVLFWIAYRSKELAVMLPVVLAGYEYVSNADWHWKRLLRLTPFLAVSLSFGLQAILANRGTNDLYTFRPTPSVLFEGVRFYSGLLLFPYAGLVLLALAPLIRDRRFRWGLSIFWTLLAPVLLLPGRREVVYLYVPLCGAAVSIAALCDVARLRRLAPAIACAWCVYIAVPLLHYETVQIDAATMNRAYVRALSSAVRDQPANLMFVYQGLPAHFRPWGIAGALGFLRKSMHLPGEAVARDANTLDLAAFSKQSPAALIAWRDDERRVNVVERTPTTQLQSYLWMDPSLPLWQLTKGWYPLEHGFRWIQPQASSRLFRPSIARRFELVVEITRPVPLKRDRTQVRVLLDSATLEARELADNGRYVLSWDVPPQADSVSEVTIDATPGFKLPTDPRTLAIKIFALGFR